MEDLFPLMGSRRKGQIRFALDSYNPELARIKLNADDVVRIRVLLGSKAYTHAQISSMFNVSRSHISHIACGDAWSDALS